MVIGLKEPKKIKAKKKWAKVDKDYESDRVWESFRQEADWNVDQFKNEEEMLTALEVVFGNPSENLSYFNPVFSEHADGTGMNELRERAVNWFRDNAEPSQLSRVEEEMSKGEISPGGIKLKVPEGSKGVKATGYESEVPRGLGEVAMEGEAVKETGKKTREQISEAERRGEERVSEAGREMQPEQPIEKDINATIKDHVDSVSRDMDERARGGRPREPVSDVSPEWIQVRGEPSIKEKPALTMDEKVRDVSSQVDRNIEDSRRIGYIGVKESTVGVEKISFGEKVSSTKDRFVGTVVGAVRRIFGEKKKE